MTMKEQLYTIPVQDAFKEECECPICAMYRSLERDALHSTMSGYMVEERRMESNQSGFCDKHIALLVSGEDRLGLAWMVKTHMEHLIEEVEHRQKAPVRQATFFQKQKEPPELLNYVEHLGQSCFVCDKIDGMLKRYLVTIVHLYKKEEEFRVLFNQSKGFCTKHYGMLYATAQAQLSKEIQQNFIADLNRLYIDNMKRVCGDVSWFINKYDYRYKEEPWKNAKDSIARAMTKLDSILPGEVGKV